MTTTSTRTGYLLAKARHEPLALTAEERLELANLAKSAGLIAVGIAKALHKAWGEIQTFTESNRKALQ